MDFQSLVNRKMGGSSNCLLSPFHTVTSGISSTPCLHFRHLTETPFAADVSIEAVQGSDQSNQKIRPWR